MIKCYRNDEEDVLGLPDGHPGDSWQLLEAKLGHDLPGLSSSNINTYNRLFH